MRIKEAPWEERNLGVAACEFYVNTDDNSEELMQAVMDCSAKYQVLHIQAGNTEALLAAQKAGFLFIEMNYQLSKKLKSGMSVMPAIYKRFEPHLSYVNATKSDMERVLSIVETGEMFDTDKVSRDPCFGKKFAGKRYSLWSRDVVAEGGKLLIAQYKESKIGFAIIREEENSAYDLFLGGIFPEYSNKGLGATLLYLELKYVMEMGGKKVLTGISSNNPPILKLYQMFDFTIDSSSYTLIRHI